jgi:lysophospholipase L1-like esterase
MLRFFAFLTLAVAASAQTNYDWANTAQYREENVKARLPERQKRVIFMGDSITVLFDLNKYFPGQPYINRGISGQVTGQMLLRFRQDVIELRPRSVVILGGINDFYYYRADVNAVLNNLKSMAELAQSNKIRVLLCSLTPVGIGAIKDDDSLLPRILATNAALKTYALEHGAIFVDYFSAMAGPDQALKPELRGDNIHPNDAGFSVMQPLVANGIAESYGSR